MVAGCRKSSVCEDARMGFEPAHFTLNKTGEFLPTQFAQSHWGEDQVDFAHDPFPLRIG
jgi:hypothetical protein